MRKSFDDQPLEERSVKIKAIPLLNAELVRAPGSKLFMIPDENQLLCVRPQSC
jgi:hypothetical protein